MASSKTSGKQGRSRSWSNVLIYLLLGLVVGGTATQLILANWVQESDPSDHVVGAVSTTTAIASESTTTTEVPWVEAGEARFESTVLTPTAIWVDGEIATLEYQLFSLGPTRPTLEFINDLPAGWSGEQGPVAAHPDEWRLAMGGALIEGIPASSGSAVRFKVPAGTTIADLGEVRLTRWRIAEPFQQVFEMPLANNETIEMPDGASVTVQYAGTQQDGVVLRFSTRRPDAEVLAGVPVPLAAVSFYVEPISEEWRVLRGGSLGDGFVLKSDRTSTPRSVLLRYTRPMWVPIDGEVIVWRGAGA